MAKAKNSGKNRAPARASDAVRGALAGRAQPRTLRIIGGRHRGRKLRFPDGIEIRPTPDRVRETLFNWLQPRIAEARVLDLFAGSGALGLEALSRGAARVVFIEKDRRAAQAIDALAQEWQEGGAQIVNTDALGWLAQPPSEAAFDLVFLDPPYDSVLLSAAAGALAASGKLAPDARIYLECRAREALPALPAGWRSLREGRAGEVGYHLFAT